MKSTRMNEAIDAPAGTARLTRRILRPLLPALLALLNASCTYMKMNPPPDADKTFLNGNNSCWLATASNVLAGASYGNGATVQARANDIYGNMTNNFGTANGGWIDTAVTWWLGSANNTWPANPYTVVTVYGNKTLNPWANANGAQFIGNELRTCHFVGLSITWPPDATHASAHNGHAITAWGDQSGNVSSISANPSSIRLTDSDQDTGGDVQEYTYDTYTNPNPGGSNSGNGWYIDYSANHPFLKHIAVLSPVAGASGGATVQKVLGSYKIHQDSEIKATDLHYTVGTDVDILSYRTWLSWQIAGAPVIAEANPRRSITVDWDLSANPVPYDNWVTITTEFILPRWNAISYSDVRFTYPLHVTMKVPSLAWQIDTPTLKEASKIPNVTGGYVVGAFDVIDPERPEGSRLVAQYRFIHQYSFDQLPELHAFSLKGPKGLSVTNLRFGHSYGYIDEAALWRFEGWMTDLSGKRYELGETAITVTLDWKGRLPYPEGEIVPWARDPKLLESYKRSR
jgi:hypothetical protein